MVPGDPGDLLAKTWEDVLSRAAATKTDFVETAVEYRTTLQLKDMKAEIIQKFELPCPDFLSGLLRAIMPTITTSLRWLVILPERSETQPPQPQSILTQPPQDQSILTQPPHDQLLRLNLSCRSTSLLRLSRHKTSLLSLSRRRNSTLDSVSVVGAPVYPDPTAAPVSVDPYSTTEEGTTNSTVGDPVDTGVRKKKDQLP